MPSQLNVIITQNSSGTVTTSTVNVAIPTSLQGLDSTAPGATQTGYSGADETIRNIFRAGVFLATSGVWYPTWVIQSITAQ